MRRALTSLAFLLLAAAGVGVGFVAESSGIARSALPEAAFDALPGDDLPAPPTSLDEATEQAREAGTGEGEDGDDERLIAAAVPPPPGGDVYWGAYRPGAPFDRDELEALTEVAGARPAMVMWYQAWEGEPLFPVAAARALTDLGVVPVLTWESWDPPPEDPSLQPDDARAEALQPRYRLDRIAAGAFDDYIERYARSVRAYGGPVVMRLFHEMDGFWYPWGGTVNGNEPEDVVRAWRHVVGIFERVGATNVAWAWTVNHESVPDVPANRIDVYYPGDAYVDWVGVDGFNFGTTSPVSTWQTFDEVYEQRFEQLVQYGKPVMVAEVASAEEGGPKAAWIRDAIAAMSDRLPSVGAFIWFDRRVGDVRDFRIASSPEAAAAFAEAVASPDVLSAPSALERVPFVPRASG